MVSSEENSPRSKMAATTDSLINSRPIVAGSDTKTAQRRPRETVLHRASKSFRAASALITGKMAVANEMPKTPSGN